MSINFSGHISAGLRYPYQPIISRPEFMWPDDASVAVWVIPNIEYYPFDQKGASVNDSASGTTPDVLNHSWRDYGVRVGFWRLLECLDDVGVKVSATLNSEVCDEYPILVEEGSKRGWEWIAHGTNNSIRMSNLDKSSEDTMVSNVIDRIEKFTGSRPQGWLGPGLAESHNSLDILQKNSIKYVCDWIADDLPFWITANEGRILSVPYSIEMNDMELVLRQKLTGPEYFRRLVDQYDQLRRESIAQKRGRVMAIPIHPFLVGQAHRIGYLRDALSYIVAQKQTWLATGLEICDFYSQLDI